MAGLTKEKAEELGWNIRETQNGWESDRRLPSGHKFWAVGRTESDCLDMIFEHEKKIAENTTVMKPPLILVGGVHYL